MKLYFNPTSTFIVRSSSRKPPPIRFNSLSRKPPLACTRVRSQKRPGSGRIEPMNRPKNPDPGPTALDNPQVHLVLFLSPKRGL